MVEERNPFELASASQPPAQEEPDFDNAREIFPVTFEKDHLDFRPRQVDEPVAEVETPKDSSVLVSATSPPSPTGLEDVSSDDLETSVLPSVEKDTSESTSLTSDAPTSLGKSEPPVVT